MAWGAPVDAPAGDAGELEREARAGTRRVDTGASDRDDIAEVEYRQVRLEKVVNA